MIEQDYIMRMINVLSAVIARVLFRKNAHEYPEALLELHTTGKTLLGVDRTLIDLLSSEQLMALFGSDLSVAMPKSYVLGVLLKEEADILCLMSREDEAALLRLKSLMLFIDTLFAAGEPIEERHTQLIDEVLELLQHVELPEAVLKKVMMYHERMGRFDRAENVLFDILEVRPEFVDEGLRFSERLLEKTEQELKAGGLSKEEVLETMAELRQRKIRV